MGRAIWLRTRWTLCGLAAGVLLAGVLSFLAGSTDLGSAMIARAADQSAAASQAGGAASPAAPVLWARLAGDSLAGGSGVTGSGGGTVSFNQPIANCAILVSAASGSTPSYSVLSDGMTLQLSDTGDVAHPVSVAIFC